MLSLLETLKQLELHFEAKPKFFISQHKSVIVPLSGRQIAALLEDQYVEQTALDLRATDHRTRLVKVSLNKEHFLKLVEIQPTEMLDILYA